MSLYTTFIQPILGNQVVTGLSFTALLGAAGYQLRSIPGHMGMVVRRSCIVKLSVYSDDPAFVWLDRWLASQPYSARAKSVVLKSYEGDEDGQGDRTWELSPGAGFHWFWWNGRFVWLYRDIEKNGDTAGRRGVNRETITLRTLGRSQAALRKMVMDAIGVAGKSDIVRVYLWRGWWATLRGKRPRSLHTIVLAEGQKERILADLAWFSSSREWYSKRGVPYRRGYIFKGPPGTGKTTIILAMAAHLGRPVCVLNLGSLEGDDDLFRAVTDAAPDAIVAIEDIDCAVSAKPRKTNKEKKATEKKRNDILGPADNTDKDSEREKVSKAALLNVLDGITTPDGRIFVMTTNHPEMLDPALIRAGRADVTEDFGLLDAKGQYSMWCLYYGEDKERTFTGKISPADMQGIFMRLAKYPNRAYEELRERTKT